MERIITIGNLRNLLIATMIYAKHRYAVSLLILQDWAARRCMTMTQRKVSDLPKAGYFISYLIKTRELGLSAADGSFEYDEILDWVQAHLA